MTKEQETMLKQIEDIRQSGLANMLDFYTVQRVAFERNHHELVEWMENHKSEYAQLIFTGKFP